MDIGINSWKLYKIQPIRGESDCPEFGKFAGAINEIT